MIKLRKFIYKFWLPMLMCVGLIFIQSQSELALPDYMSRIVSYGIQAGGIDDKFMEAMSEDTYNHLMIFTNDEESKIIKQSYTYYEHEKIKSDLIKKFPKLNNGYILNKLNKEERKQLENAIRRPLFIVSTFDSLEPESDLYKQIFGNQTINGNIFEMFSMMKSDQIQHITDTIEQQIDMMGESTMDIAFSQAVQNEYKMMGADTDSSQNQYILKMGLKMLFIALLGSLAAMCVAYLSSRVGAAFARDLRKAVFQKVESFSHNEFQKFSTASLITRTTNDITQVQMLVIMSLRIVLFAPMMGLGALYKAFVQSKSMTWIILMVLLIIGFVILILIKVVLPKFKVVQSLIDKLNLTMRENLSGVLVIRAFGNEKHSENRLEKANDELTRVNLFVNRSMSVLMPVMTFIMNFATVLIIWFGAKQLDIGNIAIGQMMAFIQYAMHIMMSFLFIAMIFVMIPRASVAASRINEVLSTPLDICDPVEPKKFNETKKGYVEFKDVSFKYPGAHEPVLSHISFEAKPGKMTAFIGSTGSGKTSIINLIPRFYDVTAGAIFVDGVNIKDVKQHDLRELIGYIPQKASLFSGTIRSNLQYGAPGATDEQLNDVLRISQALDFVQQKEKGLDEPVSQGGKNVSGGQRQRLSIARAIAKNPEILIFDDSFSALDFKTDAQLRKELAEVTEKMNTTVLVVGQRIASIMSADQIIVLNEGKIVGKGTHSELMKTCQVYQEIAYSQLSKEELNNA